MTVDRAVRRRILDITGVTALVSAASVTTLIWQENRAGTAIRVTRISDLTDAHLRGTGAARARVQVDVTAPTKDGVDALMALVHGDFVSGVATGLQGWTGTVTDGSEQLDISSILPDIGRDVFDAEERKQPITTRDYFVTYRPN